MDVACCREREVWGTERVQRFGVRAQARHWLRRTRNGRLLRLARRFGDGAIDDWARSSPTGGSLENSDCGGDGRLVAYIDTVKVAYISAVKFATGLRAGLGPHAYTLPPVDARVLRR